MIRPATTEDIPQLVDIWLRASLLAHDFIPAGFWHERAEDMASLYLPGAETYVLEAAGRAVGFAALNDDHLEALFIDPELQSFGHGTHLMAHAMSKRERITLCVYSRNVRAVSFYRRLGFQVLEERTEPLSGEQETLMLWSRTPGEAG
ncbi:GNAT family N-acetyltransferase [Billgrantia desiderata]|jgi:putative acetyltransferase|uniref:GNAT family N-acetyltransferase n=1 Tax=Billgrantia desiderata TaxID=52021 RepID=A0ABS9B253_9GAMM|nr:GNAT family N-acetyltransferase [Halomonas desiderata]MCE8013554.1 GNAT family N-acetyltransferase [Halomonas desiderata]MCE8030758.1 GNAT family N-acetyltransferase [Halomonas desiderata]MCE8041264.1 GNAT family N-acetyltransferase [Halomonas desiderata]MCE8045839.1 GNAT family N-acetyltransferase [Halomonas desiderata]NIC35269.1 GNAT family N-acetyltransferase [Halomonas desiderata]